MYIFDEFEWKEKIQDPLWYHEIPKVMKELVHMREENEETFRETKERIYSFFERELAAESVSLGSVIKDFDSERTAIDTIVVHHTHGEESMSPERLSAMELLRLYAPYFLNPTYEPDKGIKNKPLYSGHERGGQQVFYPYHWIIRKDGTSERLLLDKEVGWHAGEWSINCRSIGIALDANYENSSPSMVELQAIAAIVKQYPQVSKDRIVGHREINLKTTCPSNLFLPTSEHGGWKEELLSLL